MKRLTFLNGIRPLGVAIVTLGLLVSAASAQKAEPAPQDPTTSTSSPDGLRISVELAALCRVARDREQLEKCLEGVKSGLSGGARRFSGWRSIDSKCIGRNRVKVFIESLSTEAAQHLVQSHKPVTSRFVGDDELILRTGMTSSTSYYLDVRAIENSLPANCRYSAVSWLAFAQVALKDGSVVIRSDALASGLDAIVEKQLASL